jgi:hypothetical protein
MLQPPASQLSRVSLAVKDDVATNPSDILLLGTVAVVTNADRSAHLIEQARLICHGI